MSNKIGKRPIGGRQAHEHKRELHDVVGELYDLGLGGYIIGELLGYSRGYISAVRRVDKRPKPSPAYVLLKLIPEPLKGRVFAIRMRSAEFYASKGIPFETALDDQVRALAEVEDDIGVC